MENLGMFYLYLRTTFCTYSNIAAVFLDYEKVDVPYMLERGLSRITVITSLACLYIVSIRPILEIVKEKKQVSKGTTA